MASILENIKEYFKKKDAGETVQASPEGTCPVCWGRSEWDGKHYEIVKDKHSGGTTTYDSFISKIVDEHVRTTHNLKDKYICTNCDKEI
ncbi:MAG: hypothetical protein ACI857_000723 [Arenicella sp.]|jgi:hypothetical protein